MIDKVKYAVRLLGGLIITTSVLFSAGCFGIILYLLFS